ncbi:hypothetical protein EPN44_16120 [bacterium]|nr:MAG: hypothetical protein EPN44_16120 [bacterium]
MKKVHQTLFGRPDGPNAEIGNCYPACVASLLGLDLDQVPHFHQLHDDAEGALDEILAFLHGQGYSCLRYEWAPWVNRYLPGALAIFGGKSPRGDWSHAVVGQVTADGWRLVHDPHPSGAGILGDPVDVEVLFPLMRAEAA